MITVSEAEEILRRRVPSPRKTAVPLRRGLGHVLAEEIRSDGDVPPFDRAMMDGYAVIAEGGLEAEVVEEIPAGRCPSKTIVPGTCAKIMTGAPLPAGADAVQQVEKTRREGPRVRLLEPVRPGQNVSPRGEHVRRGEVVLREGKTLGPADAGILASVGRTEVEVWARPSVAVLVTGDEIVEPDAPVGPAQIRNSNAYSLQAQLAVAGFETRYLGIAPDREDALAALISDGLQADALLITGGVSAGDWDLVVPVLEAQGVRHELHRVKIKPGKPLFFGTRDRTVVFGLPGNPVSTFVTFEVFVRPFLGWMMNADLRRRRVPLRLRGAVSKKIDRELYLPGRLRGDGGVEPLRWGGSGDLFALSEADALIVVPVETAYEEGASVDVLLL